MQPIRDVMSRDVKVISPDTSLKSAAALMRDGNLGMLPVGEDDRMIGTVTDRDIAIRAVAEGWGCDTPVRDVMSEEVVWCYEDETVGCGAEKMSEHQVRRLPVLSREKRLVGIVSLGDFAVEAEDVASATEALVAISRP